jgi:hypothetical protein
MVLFSFFFFKLYGVQPAIKLAGGSAGKPPLGGAIGSFGGGSEEGEQWDLCFVVALHDKLDDDVAEALRSGATRSVSEVTADDKAREVHAMQERMAAAGLETKEYLSVQNDEIYLLVRAPEPLLEELAEASETELECYPDVVKQYGLEMRERFPGAVVHPFSIPDNKLLKAENNNDISNVMRVGVLDCSCGLACVGVRLALRGCARASKNHPYALPPAVCC